MPISDCEVRDPRVRRTRLLLQKALHKLMETKSFDEISVQDIAEAATVNRATFYDHYSDKYALLEASVAGGFHQMLGERQVRFDGTCPGAASAIILATCDYLMQMPCGEAVVERQKAFQPLVDAAITAAIRRVLLEGISRHSAGLELSPEMIATAAAGAIYGAVREWSLTLERGPAEEIVPVILKFVLPILSPSEDAAAVALAHATSDSNG